MTEKTRIRRRTALLFAAYSVALTLIAFWPSPVDGGIAGFIDRVLNALHRFGVPERVDYDLVETGSNVALFIPFGVLAAAYLPLNMSWIAVVAGAFASVLIEAGQELFLPGRFATLQDVLANTLGAALGTVIVYAWICRASRRPR